jgi:adenylyltransferase/sulfurtransferase
MKTKLEEQEQIVKVKINIPAPLRAYVNNQKIVIVHASTIQQSLEKLIEHFPLLRPHLFNEDDTLRNFVNIYLDGEDIRFLPNKSSTALKEGSNINIVPSIAGG